MSNPVTFDEIFLGIRTILTGYATSADKIDKLRAAVELWQARLDGKTTPSAPDDDARGA